MRLERLTRALRRHGVAGTARRAGALARDAAVLREEHVWYELPLTGERPRRELPEGMELVDAGRGGLDDLERLPTISRAEAEERLAGGAELWLVREGATPAFACWIFRRRTPVLAAPGGWLALPDGTVCLEDSVTSPGFRGRGVAPGAWAAIADALATDGIERIVTKVEVANVPSRKAVEKAGFRQVGVMRLSRILGRKRVALDASAPAGEALGRELARR